MGNILAIALRIAAYRDQIMQVWAVLLPLIQVAMKTYPELADLIKKIVPEVNLPKAEARSAAVVENPFTAEWLQLALNKLDNAALEIDGIYGERTKAAVAAYQQAHGLPVDGWAGINTLSSILKELS